jgi:hypothetical protein
VRTCCTTPAAFGGFNRSWLLLQFLKKGTERELQTGRILEVDGYKRKDAAKWPDGPVFAFRLVQGLEDV